jgi:hypothetical protein
MGKVASDRLDIIGGRFHDGASEHIAQVFDQYLNFIVAEPDLFSLGLGNDAYYKISQIFLP